MANLKILVVDDATFIREMVRKTIRARFPTFSVEEAVNGRKAQQILGKEKFDLILCDWEMPEMSGIELLSWLRKEQKQKTPFIMVTSRGDKANVVEAVQAGVNDYMGKPFSREKLIGKVVKVLSKFHNLNLEGSGGSQGSPSGSAAALTGGAPAARKLAAKPASEKKPAAMPKQVASKGAAHLRFGDSVKECAIKAISLKQISLIAPADGNVPSILEAVVIDLQQGAEVARINAYVHQLQATEPKMDSRTISIGITVVDNDPQKLTFLSKLIARGTTSTSFVPGA